jgi:alpha-N-arabinofuranosidase
MKRFFLVVALMVTGITAFGQASIQVKSGQPAGNIDPMLYGQLFEHIYFSANNGVWQELIYERSFEPEHYPGIPPRDGYFDGWFADEDQVLHSPTRYEQPIRLADLDTDSYDLEMDVKWRSYLLPGRRWSGGLLDLRFAFKDLADGSDSYYLRLYDPAYEGQRFNLSQTQAQIEADNQAKALAKVQKTVDGAQFALSTRQEKEVSMFGRTRKVVTLEPLAARAATPAQLDQEAWHHLKISCRGQNVRVWWDGKQVLSTKVPDSRQANAITLWENYTEAFYRNISVTSAKGKTVLFEGLPEDVKLPAVAPQWKSFGEGKYRLVKGDAVNMDYAQEITAGTTAAGVAQGPQNVVAGETFVGSVYAKGDGKLSVALVRDGRILREQALGVPGPAWKKFDISLPAGDLSGDADFAILAKDGTLRVDQATLSTATGQANGGFRPDILQAVKDLHPTCLRWPGGGYVAQYYWQWGIGPQENRYRWPHWMWMDYDQNCFGTDEFIRFCREVNTEPVIVVSVHFERPAEEYDSILADAVNWVRYCNAPATDEWGAKRAANGHPEPYNVKYWEIDNEMWEMGIDRYEKCVRDFSTAMREVDPSIKIIACGGFREDEDFLRRSANYFDYLSLHHYEQAGGYATGPARLGEQYDRYAKMIAASPNPNVKLFISEWNLNSTDWRTGLFAGGFLNACEARDVVAMGAAALFIRRTDAPDWNNAFINFDYKDLFVAPNYLVTELWYDHFSRYLLDYEGETGDLSVVTTLSENGRDVIVKVVNPTEEAIDLKVSGDWKGIARTAYDYYAPGSLTAANSMADKNAVKLMHASPAAKDGGVTLHVEPLSAGVLTLTKQF